MHWHNLQSYGPELFEEEFLHEVTQEKAIIIQLKESEVSNYIDYHHFSHKVE